MDRQRSTNVGFRGVRILGKALALGTVATLASAAPAPAKKQAGGATLGLVLTDVRYALYQTPDAKEECPAGLQVADSAQFKAQDGYKAHLDRFGGSTQNRGAHGETANWVPEAMTDALPWHELASKKGPGVNLDGTDDGHATGKTCTHEKFVDAQGAKVDNQMARVLGCILGWRKTGFMAEFYSKEVETSPTNRMLVEISGVDNEQNDPSVEVAIYKGRDRLVRTATGTTFLPFMSHRIDTRFPQYTYKTHGRIVDGTLITDPIPAFRMPLVQIQIVSERRMNDMVLRLKLNGDGATGLLGGYENLDEWWNLFAKSPGSDPGHYSPSLVYQAAHRFADGYPDPKTRQCTAISTAYQVSAVRALIVHSDGDPTRVAMRGH